MASYYIWIKALHIAFMVTWFAGLFYLPRLFIYHVQIDDIASRKRFTTMEKRLFGIMTVGAVITALLGITLVAINPALTTAPWFLTKIALIIGLVIYHYRCWLWIRRLQATNAVEDSKWLRWFNEIPVMFLLGIIILAVVKPF
jgi:putative membrane protein